MKVWRKRLLVTTLITALIIAGVSLFIIGTRREKAVEPVEKKPVPVTVLPLQPREFVQEIEYTGKLEAISDVQVTAKARGTVVEDLVKEGDRVKKGQALFRLDDDSYRLAMAQAQAALDLARENYRKTREITRPEELFRQEAFAQEAGSALKKAESDARRFDELYREGAVPLSQKESADLALDAARARARVTAENLNQARAGARDEDIAAAEASVRQAGAAFELAEDAWKDTVIRSPISGIVARKKAFDGDTLEVGMAVAEIVDLSSFKITLGCTELDLGSMNKGDKADVRVLSIDQSLGAVIVDVGVKADQATGTFPIILNMKNPDKGRSSLRAGMDVRVSFARERIPDALVIPKTALLRQTGAPAVFIVDDDVAVRKVVVLGPRNDTHAVVTTGLREGDLLVVVGQHRLLTGDEVDLAVER